MKATILGLIPVCALINVAAASSLDPDLENRLSVAGPHEIVSTLVYLSDQVDTAALSQQMDRQRATMATRHETIVRTLQDHAYDTQRSLLSSLDARLRDGSVSYYEPYWIGNIIRLDATPERIREIAAREEVDVVFFNYPIELADPVKRGPVDDGARTRAVETGIAAVRAPEVWALGYDGSGVLVANMDTGVDGDHPALSTRWAGTANPLYAGHPEWAWFDPYTSTSYPFDENGHGTHTMGTICGESGSNQIGVAPGAQWIAAAPIDRSSNIDTTMSDAILSFQWFADPDGNPATSWDVPAVCSNSWGIPDNIGYPDCDSTFWSYIDNLEAAGCLVVFAAGNEGPGGNTLRSPSDRATTDYNVFSVGAVDARTGSFPIASFSARGPSYCGPGGSAAIKPEISAPGVQVRSAIPGGGYEPFDGTSMATPHVAGVVALVRQANPDLSVDALKQILFDSAQDLGATGEDNTYGWGMIDAYDAVQLALSTTAVAFAYPNGLPEFIDPLGGTTVRVEVSSDSALIEANSGILYYSTGGAYTPVPMTMVERDVYDAIFPTFGCGETVTYYFSVETVGGETAYSPYTAPDTTHSGDVFSGVTTTVDNFETDQGWSVSAGATTGNWERANPQETSYGFFSVTIAQPEDDHSPDGTLCWVTDATAGSSAGDYDVDGGPSRLTSPILHEGEGDVLIGYWRWYHISTEIDDSLVIQVSANDGATWTTVESVSNRQTWTYAEWNVNDYVTLTPDSLVRVRFTVHDTEPGSLIEALIDDLSVSIRYCEEIVNDCNENGIDDADDIASGTSDDRNGTGIPDECEQYPGDMNCDGVIDFGDINPFVVALSSQGTYEADHPGCLWINADVSGDGLVDFDDINPFVGLLSR